MFKRKCAKCGLKTINIISESFGARLWRITKNIMFPIRILMSVSRRPKSTNVCRSCGFSWEDR